MNQHPGAVTQHHCCRAHRASGKRYRSNDAAKNPVIRDDLGILTYRATKLQYIMDTSKEERIAARRLRIQQKLAARQGAGTAGSTGAAMIIHEKADVRIGELARSAQFLSCGVTIVATVQANLRSPKAGTGCAGC